MRQKVGVKMVAEPGLDNTVIDEKKEYFQGFLNKEEFSELHSTKSDMDICNEAISKVKIEDVNALLAKESPLPNFEKGFECIMMLVGGGFSGKEMTESNYKFFTKKFKGRESDLLM
jgi:hypothetical protein